MLRYKILEITTDGIKLRVKRQEYYCHAPNDVIDILSTHQFFYQMDSDAKKKEKSICKHIAVKVRRRRQVLGLERKALARALGVSDGTVSNFEKGRHSISAERLWLIAGVLQCSPVDLLPPIPQDFSEFDKKRQEIDDAEAREWLAPLTSFAQI